MIADSIIIMNLKLISNLEEIILKIDRLLNSEVFPILLVPVFLENLHQVLQKQYFIHDFVFNHSDQGEFEAKLYWDNTGD